MQTHVCLDYTASLIIHCELPSNIIFISCRAPRLRSRQQERREVVLLIAKKTASSMLTSLHSLHNHPAPLLVKTLLVELAGPNKGPHTVPTTSVRLKTAGNGSPTATGNVSADPATSASSVFCLEGEEPWRWIHSRSGVSAKPTIRGWMRKSAGACMA